MAVVGKTVMLVGDKSTMHKHCSGVSILGSHRHWLQQLQGDLSSPEAGAFFHHSSLEVVGPIILFHLFVPYNRSF